MLSFSENWIDVRSLGLSVLNCYFGRFSKSRIGIARLRDVGRVMPGPHQSDMACLRQVFVGGQHDLAWVAYVQQRRDKHSKAILSHGRLLGIVDDLANIGAWSLWSANMYPEAKILPVEPDADTFRILQ